MAMTQLIINLRYCSMSFSPCPRNSGVRSPDKYDLRISPWKGNPQPHANAPPGKEMLHASWKDEIGKGFTSN